MKRVTRAFADVEQISVVELRAAPGDNALLLSDRPGDAGAFYVLEGVLTFRLGDVEHRVEPETWVFVPSAVAYTLAVAGDEPARFLQVQVPGAGTGHEIVVRRAGGAEGETIPNRPPERRATVLVETEELTISEFDYGPGERGAKLHVHREHADAFLVLDGEFTFHFRDGSRALPGGTLLVIPPGVVHGFDNDGDVNARCFNFHAPSLGFADYMRGRNADFDQHDPPEDGGLDPAAAAVVHLG
jgi:mannose-6-phosphate isomerase-like protein (cupin superfamily)